MIQYPFLIIIFEFLRINILILCKINYCRIIINYNEHFHKTTAP